VETPLDRLFALEMKGLHATAKAVAEAALKREESLGTHWRIDWLGCFQVFLANSQYNRRCTSLPILLRPAIFPLRLAFFPRGTEGSAPVFSGDISAWWRGRWQGRKKRDREEDGM